MVSFCWQKHFHAIYCIFVVVKLYLCQFTTFPKWPRSLWVQARASPAVVTKNISEWVCTNCTCAVTSICPWICGQMSVICLTLFWTVHVLQDVLHGDPPHVYVFSAYHGTNCFHLKRKKPWSYEYPLASILVTPCLQHCSFKQQDRQRKFLRSMILLNFSPHVCTRAKRNCYAHSYIKGTSVNISCACDHYRLLNALAAK